MHLKVWCYLIVTANYKPSKVMVGGRLITIERGEVLTSRARIAEVCGCSVQTVRTILNHLVEDQMIAKKSTRMATILSIVNYGRYQDYQPDEQPPINRQSTANQPPINHILRKKELKNERIEERRESVGAKAPSRDDVHTLFRIRGQSIEEADRFFDHYDAQGWVRGNGQVIHNWQALIPRWIEKQKEINNGNTKRNRGERVGYTRDTTAEYLSEIAGAIGGVQSPQARPMAGATDRQALLGPDDTHPQRPDNVLPP
jgi:predicted transcriptional regulator